MTRKKRLEDGTNELDRRSSECERREANDGLLCTVSDFSFPPRQCWIDSINNLEVRQVTT